MIPKTIKILLQTNIFVAFAAVCFMWTNCLLLNIPLSKIYYLSAQIFCSTFLVYQLSRFVYYLKIKDKQPNEIIYEWIDKNILFTKISIVISTILTIFFSLLLQPKTQIVIACLGLISVLYPFPIFKIFGSNKRLRDIPFVKIFLIAIVWSITSVLLPVLEVDFDRNYINLVLFLTFIQAIYILFITLPFDMNDIEVDKKTGVKTIPNTIGLQISNWIILILGLLYIVIFLFCSALINFAFAKNIITEFAMIGILLLIIFLFIYSMKFASKVEKWKIMLVYDGSMIVYFLISLIAKYVR